MNKLMEHREPPANARRSWRSAARSAIVFLSSAAMLAASGCTTLQTVEPQAAAEVEPGETVVVSLRDGREVELVFADWTSEALTGTDETGILQKFENDDIASVEVQRHSTVKSVGLGIVVAGFLAGIAAAASGSGGIGY